MKLGEAMVGYKPEKMPNIIRLNSDELPDVKNWKPGQRYRIVLDVEQQTMSMGGNEYDSPSGKKPSDQVQASFKVLSAKPQYGGGAIKQNASGKPDKSATMNALQRKVVS